MTFRVAARALTELGAELISSDDVALYELIKNAIDAGSKSGVEIRFVNTISYRDYQDLKAKLKGETNPSRKQFRDEIISAIQPDAPEYCKRKLIALINSKNAQRDLLGQLNKAYEKTTYITISDTGHGMDLEDLESAFLTVGTPYRLLDGATSQSSGEASGSGYLGEKGIGRLSAMRLGDRLEVVTSKRGNTHYSVLELDWRVFNANPEQMLSEIEVAPVKGAAKDDPGSHGTELIISHLTTTWTQARVGGIAEYSIGRIYDPFDATAHPRFAIKVYYNDNLIPYNNTIRRALIENSHGSILGNYTVKKKTFKLTISMQAPLYKAEPETQDYTREELPESLYEAIREFPRRSLTGLGSFSFKLYWFNRRFIKKPPGFETRTDFVSLLNKWTGITLYRDGYQVRPYGIGEDDWLELDKDALRASGFKLNKIQFVGKVDISRSRNRDLIDQTNREGLRDTDAKQILVEIIRFAIFNCFKTYISNAAEDLSRVEYDEKKATSEVERIAKDAQSTFSSLRHIKGKDRRLLKQLHDAFDQVLDYYGQAAAHIKEIEDEHERLIQLAGIGLSVEVVAHELSRLVNATVKEVHKFKRGGGTDNVEGFYNLLEAQIKAIDKRLRTIDPLSVSGRNRKTRFNLRELVERVVGIREDRLKRHQISVTVRPKAKTPILINAVEGKIFQIVENLIVNSIYWLGVAKENKKTLKKRIDIELSDNPPKLTISDNGVGVPKARADLIFRPFYSTKRYSRRRGLGLYIARENAEYHGGHLYLDTSGSPLPNGRYSTFVLELPE